MSQFSCSDKFWFLLYLLSYWNSKLGCYRGLRNLILWACLRCSWNIVYFRFSFFFIELEESFRLSIKVLISSNLSYCWRNILDKVIRVNLSLLFSHSCPPILSRSCCSTFYFNSLFTMWTSNDWVYLILYESNIIDFASDGLISTVCHGTIIIFAVYVLAALFFNGCSYW